MERLAASTVARLRTFGDEADRLTTEGMAPFDGSRFLCAIGNEVNGPVNCSLLKRSSSSPSGEGSASEMYDEWECKWSSNAMSGS
jgi:hypothetical protein